MSEEFAQSFKKMSFTKELEINVKNKWVSSENLKMDFCPEFVFNISVLRNTMTIHFTKYITNWTDDVIFKSFSIAVDNDVCCEDDDAYYNEYRKRSSKTFYKNRIMITCETIWYGFNDDLLSARINKNMETYLKNVEFSDVKIRVKNNEEFPAHKVVLASNSSVFKNMLTTDMKESKENCINFPELDSDTVNKLLHFLYHGKLDKASDNSAILLELVKAADMYLISDLKRVCDAFLSRLLSSENVFLLLEISRTINLPIVRQQSLIFIANHVDVLFEEEM
ncbi:Similar to SPOPL: Speckle-type POZ protein-like (Homo sapiens) [Cotesia congregata]|uniref:Similar to SPOPL: Speckle-type POZ protein-like (Homo sapiens) n=1 Tax=Cotesia congregata TaxID=51543 RepID=A0A8J2HEW2_COTCN|nr:Similar to SPOPL: Speckle-type POZ protein-like (Homo sapiens) [Cotesia congregata]